MKKIILFTFLILSISAFAQVEYKPKTTNSTSQNEVVKPEKKIRKEPPKQNIIKINLLSPIVSTIMLFYQRNINEESSFQIGMGYMDFYGFGSNTNTYYNGNTNTSVTSERSRGFFFTPEYRYLFDGEYMDGIFIAPFLKYTFMQYDETQKNVTEIYNQGNYTTQTTYSNTSNSYNSLGIGITIGKQFIFKNKISLEVFGGPVYNILLSGTSTEINISHSMNNVNIRGYGARAGMTVGFLF